MRANVLNRKNKLHFTPYLLSHSKIPSHTEPNTIKISASHSTLPLAVVTFVKFATPKQAPIVYRSKGAWTPLTAKISVYIAVVWLMKYHGVRSLGARQVLTRLEPEEASLYFAGASGPIFPGRKCLAYAWSVTRDSRIVGPEAEDPGGGGVEQRPRQLARSHFRSLIEKLVRISVLVDQNSI